MVGLRFFSSLSFAAVAIIDYYSRKAIAEKPTQ